MPGCGRWTLPARGIEGLKLPAGNGCLISQGFKDQQSSIKEERDMPKESGEHHCCCHSGKFWWGLLVGVVLAVVLHMAICMHCCRGGGMSGCPMTKPTAQSQPAK
jgi:hypothetical protein